MNPAIKTIISYSIFTPIYTLLYVFGHNQINGSYPLENLEHIFSWYLIGSIILYLIFFVIAINILRSLTLVPESKSG